MSSINRLTLVGNVGRTPEVKYFDNGRSVANFTLATTEKGYTAKNGTAIPDRTEWHNVVVWGNQAKYVERYIQTGSRLYVEGKLRTRSYTKEGETSKRYVSELYVEDLIVLANWKPQDGENSAPEQPESNGDDLPF